MFNREESLKVFIKRYKATSLYIGISILLFLLTVLDGGSTNQMTLMKYGALYGPLVKEGEFYRLVTCMFLHIGFMHLIFNMFVLYIFGSELESLVGWKKYSIYYFLSGIGGSVATFFFNNTVLTAGASGALFGVMGVFLALIHKKIIITEEYKKTITSFIAINIVITLMVPGISITGHLGGLIVGYILGYLTNKR